MEVMGAEEKERSKKDYSRQELLDVHNITTVYTLFLELFCFSQGLTAIFLIISGVLQILWISGSTEEDPHLSTFKNLCWMIISCGIFLLLWTVSVWIIYSCRAISLSVTCGVSNFIILILLYFIYCGGDYQQQLQSQFHLCFIIIFCVIIIFTIFQVLFTIARHRNSQESQDHVSTLLEKESNTKHTLKFCSDVYHC